MSRRGQNTFGTECKRSNFMYRKNETWKWNCRIWFVLKEEYEGKYNFDRKLYPIFEPIVQI